MAARITQELHHKAKSYLLWHTTKQTARKFGISQKTVLQVRGSRTFEEYTENNKAQHPDTGHSLRDDLLEIHNLLFNKHDNKYIAPPTGVKAAMEIKLMLLKERRQHEGR